MRRSAAVTLIGVAVLTFVGVPVVGGDVGGGSLAIMDASENGVGRGVAQVLAQAREPQKRPAAGKKPAKKEQKAEPAPVRGIDTSGVWKTETDVFSAEQLAKLEPILHASTCRDTKAGCLYQDNGKPGSEASFAFRLIPWKVSKYRSYLVRNDRCGAGGCDEGLFVLVDGRWRLVVETFGILERAGSATLGFNDLRFTPRGQAPVRLEWDGRAYREAPDTN
jgi:hypothetical protein